jgi:hypothetical protein
MREIKYLGYIVSKQKLTADPQHIEAILNYPAPKNHKQLRKFLGTCNYHHRFIINYAEYIASLLKLLKKGSKWQWCEDMQRAFGSLRRQFAHIIHLVQPNDELPYVINTDASSRAIGAVLSQMDAEDNVCIVSTVSRF